MHSPSAEVRGHGPGQEVLQTGKRDVDIVALEPVGSYAVQPRFSDGHDTGIYSWEYLYELGENQERLWAEYLAKLQAAAPARAGRSSREGQDPLRLRARSTQDEKAARVRRACSTASPSATT